jgi:hypothetical protein
VEKLTEGYIIVKKLKNHRVIVIATRHLKRKIVTDWKGLQKAFPDAPMILLKCVRLDSWNVNERTQSNGN